MNTYFIERCAGGPKSKDFWPTAKPFLTNKGIVNQKDTVLSENDVLITKQDEVCEIFNNFFVNVAKNIGNNQINVDGDHPSILEIKNNHPELHENSFSFSSINPDFVEKCIKEAQVAPIHKKNSVLVKGNYRPVSVLPAISKMFENAIEAQLVNYF
jgi:hypothetical protein